MPEAQTTTTLSGTEVPREVETPLSSDFLAKYHRLLHLQHEQEYAKSRPSAEVLTMQNHLLSWINTELAQRGDAALITVDQLPTGRVLYSD